MKAETVLAFDYGRRRIGVAIGQTLTGTATPLTTLHCDDGRPDWTAIAALIDEWRPHTLVVGMPRHLDGGEHELCAEIERFCRQLDGRFHLPVCTVDERLSSAEAETRLKGLRSQGRRRKLRKDEIDQLAAAIMLETWMSGEGQ